MKKYIHWVYSGEPGSWRSSEGRFEIIPDYIPGTDQIDEYRLYDRLANTRVKYIPTVKKAKQLAESVVKEDWGGYRWKKYPPYEHPHFLD